MNTSTTDHPDSLIAENSLAERLRNDPEYQELIAQLIALTPKRNKKPKDNGLFVYRVEIQDEIYDKYIIFAIAHNSSEAKEKIRKGWLEGHPVLDKAKITSCRKATRKEMPSRVHPRQNETQAMQSRSGDYIVF